jgi:signal transduction histidine kinase/NO-binding membrane sensor protein with MHYT domain/ActR/RegA family two-component response regulator
VYTVLTCIGQEHDLRFVALAAVICVVAAVSAFGFFRRAQGSRSTRAAWIALTGLVGGSGIWATHFIAMLAYEPKLNIHYAVGWTAVSWVVATSGVAAGFAVANWRPGLAGRGVGGLLVGLSIGAMHFLGMAAVRLDGLVLWRPGFVVASLVIGALGAAAALATVSDKPGWRRELAPPILFVLAIVGLHFTAMAAAVIVPGQATPLGASLIDRGLLVVIVGVLTTFIFAAAGGLVLMERFTKGTTFKSIRTALDAVPSGVAFFDRTHQLFAWNRPFEAMMTPSSAPSPGLEAGLPLHEVLAKAAAADVLPYAGGVETLCAEIVATAEPAIHERQVGERRWVRLEVRKTPDGGVALILADTTAANTHALSLAAARDAAEAANRAKTEFLANMSHEIRTPLNGVLGIAEALGRTELTAKQAEMLRVIRESGETLDTLLGDILDLARVESGEIALQPEPVRLADICASVGGLFEPQAREKRLTLTVSLGPGARARVLADPLRVRQVLTNLVSNAVKFTETGGVTIALAREGDRFRLEVRDTGPGLPPAVRARLFQRFGQADGSTTRAHGGVGLGLPLSRRLADLMDADLECQSSPGQGSTFVLSARFPVLEEEAGADAPATPPRVLVVDDNAVNRQVLELILDSAGIEHASAENGAVAVQAVQTGAFDAVLMDIQMPVMDGLEATRRIRRWETETGRPPHPIYIVSANCLPEHVEAGRAAGADGHVAKPVNAAKVLAALAGEPAPVEARAAPARRAGAGRG